MAGLDKRWFYVLKKEDCQKAFVDGGWWMGIAKGFIYGFLLWESDKGAGQAWNGTVLVVLLATSTSTSRQYY